MIHAGQANKTCIRDSLERNESKSRKEGSVEIVIIADNKLTRSKTLKIIILEIREIHFGNIRNGKSQVISSQNICFCYLPRSARGSS